MVVFFVQIVYICFVNAKLFVMFVDVMSLAECQELCFEPSFSSELLI